jgi:hypothetical protein
MTMFRNLLIVTLAFMSMTIVRPAAAGETFIKVEYLISRGHTYVILNPDAEQKCARFDTSWFDTSSMTHDKDTTIIGEAFIPNKPGYVYWLSKADGAHEVFFTSYLIRNCVVTENSTHFQQFDGEKTFERAREYYIHTLKQMLE